MTTISASAATAPAAPGRSGTATSGEAGPATEFAALVGALTDHLAAGASDVGAPAGPLEAGTDDAPSVEVAPVLTAGAAGELAGAALLALLAAVTSASVTAGAAPTAEAPAAGAPGADGALALFPPAPAAGTEAAGTEAAGTGAAGTGAAGTAAAGTAAGTLPLGGTPGAAAAPDANSELVGPAGAAADAVLVGPGDGTDPAGPVPGEPLAEPADGGAPDIAAALGAGDGTDDAVEPGPGRPGSGPPAAGTPSPAVVPPLPGSAVPVAPVGGLDPAGASTDAARPAPSALSDQLVSVVAPLRRGADGTHQLSLQLRPEELGGLHVDVRILGNQISLHLRAEVPATNDLLRANLEQLRADLEAAGFDAGSLDVGDRDKRSPEPDDGGAPTTGAAARAADAADAVPVPRPTPDPTTSLTAAGLDIRL